MSTSSKLNEYNHAEEPARVLLQRLGWTYVSRETLAAERIGEREVLLKGRLRAALLRLNEWMTEEQSERVIFNLEHVDATGMARNQAVHEYLTLRDASDRGRAEGTRYPHRPLLRLRPPGRRPQRVRRHHPAPSSPGQRTLG